MPFDNQEVDLFYSLYKTEASVITTLVKTVFFIIALNSHL